MNPSTHRHSWDSSCSRVPWERLDASLRSDFMGEGCTFTKVSSYLLRHRATTGLLDTLVRIELRTLAQAGTVPIFEPCVPAISTARGDIRHSLVAVPSRKVGVWHKRTYGTNSGLGVPDYRSS